MYRSGVNRDSTEISVPFLLVTMFPKTSFGTVGFINDFIKTQFFVLVFLPRDILRNAIPL